MPRETMNEKSIEYQARNGTQFKSERGDLRCDVMVTPQQGVTIENKMADFTEFGAWHSLIVRPHLNVFSGYDSIRYQLSI